jgi:hypothetical protein
MSKQIATAAQARGQKELERHVEGLSAKQAIALGVIMKGGTITAAAVEAGVGRRCMYAWLEEGKPLRVAMDLWKQDLAQCARTRLVMLTDLATGNVAGALKNGDVKTAMRLLERLGIMAAPPTGATEQEVKRDRVEEENIATRKNREEYESMFDIESWNKQLSESGVDEDQATGDGKALVGGESEESSESGAGGSDGGGDEGGV